MEGDDVLTSSQFDYDEDNFINDAKAIHDDDSVSGASDAVSEDDNDEETQAEATAKGQKRKNKFAELKERRKKFRTEKEISTGTASKTTAANDVAQCKAILAVFKGTRFSRDGIEPALFLSYSTPTAPNKKKTPFFSCIQHAIPDFQNVKKSAHVETGSPLVLIITAGAARSAEIVKSESVYRRCKIAKLFAKHFKVEEQVEMLRESHPIAIGTPNRLKKLLDIGALSLASTKLVIVDIAVDNKV